MLQSGSSAEEKKAFLKCKGWVHDKKPHAWQWHLPPTPGLYMLDDAVAVQLSMDKQKKAKEKAAVT